MGHVVLLNLVFFVPAVCGAATFAWLLMRFLRTSAPPSGGEGGSRVGARRGPHAGPDDLARSA